MDVIIYQMLRQRIKISFQLMVLITLIGFAVIFTSQFTYAANGKRSIAIELEEVEGATTYEIQLISNSSGKSSSFKMKKPEWTAQIKPGEYKFKLRSFDSRNVPGPWSEEVPLVIKTVGPDLIFPEPDARVLTKTKDQYELEFKWEGIPNAKSYRLEVLPVGSEEKLIRDFDENTGKIELPVAKSYTWTVRAISKSGIEGEAQEKPGSFSLIGDVLDTPEIERPEDIYVESIKWTKPEYAEQISYVLSKQNGDKKWEKIESDLNSDKTEIPFDTKLPGGRYRLAVQAEGQLREKSKVAKIDFEVYKGDRSPASIQEVKLRDSLEKPTRWYFIASWMLSNIEYTGIDGSRGNQTSQYNTFGGTGRLGLGYINEKRGRGLFGIFDLSGYTINGDVVNWAAAELHYVWKKSWGRNLFRPSAGIFYKELKETTALGPNRDTYKHELISYGGPHLGFEFWQPVTSKLGWQVNARMYYGMFDIDTPANSQQSPQTSEQIGFMGSYRLSQKMMGFVGLTHRTDRAVYKTTGPAEGATVTGPNQEIEISGSYLNFLLEWAF